MHNNDFIANLCPRNQKEKDNVLGLHTKSAILLVLLLLLSDSNRMWRSLTNFHEIPKYQN